ncbi:MAG: hypothetical protein R3F61_17370 [Myxococcota bacterium]
MFDPPPQLRTSTDLEALTVRVSGRPWSSLDLLRDSSIQNIGWGLVVALSFATPVLPPLGFVAAGVVVVLQIARLLEPTGGALETRLRLTATQLETVRDGEKTTTPWNQVGRVHVTPGSVVEVMRAGAEPLLIPMELEPTEHAVWVASAIEERAKAARKQLGSTADIPRSIRKLRT